MVLITFILAILSIASILSFLSDLVAAIKEARSEVKRKRTGDMN